MSLLITNRILHLLGSEATDTIDNNDWAKIINPLVTVFYHELLEQNAWSFASKYSVLGKNTLSDNPKFLFSYTLPADFMRIIEVYKTKELKTRLYKYRINGTKLFSDVDGITIKYITNSVNVDETSETFKIALAYRVIMNVGVRLLNDKSLVRFYAEMDKIYFNKAIITDFTQMGENRKFMQKRIYL